MHRLLFLSPSHREQHYHKAVLRIRIRGLFDSWIRDPGWVKKSRSGSGMNIPDHVSES